MTGPALAVVLVHRDQPERLLASLAAFTADPAGERATYVVVDNASTPECRRRLHEGLAQGLAGHTSYAVEVLELSTNVGFGPGANAGLRRALGLPAELVAVAPHDALPEPGTLSALADGLADRPRAGLVSADVGDGRRPHHDPYFGGITLPRGREVGWEDCDYPHGTLFVARAACLREVGLFDERYFAYCEEADLGRRARDAGWQVGIVHGARVHNPELGGTSAAVDYLMSRNTLLLVREHSGRYHALVRAAMLAAQLVHGTVRPSSRPWIFSSRGRAWALVDHARRRYGPPPTHLLHHRAVRSRRGVGARD